MDLNLLVDWAWPAFLHHAPAFVAAVPSPPDLCDLLAALRPDSVCGPGGLYSGIPVEAPKPKQQQVRRGGGGGMALYGSM